MLCGLKCILDTSLDLLGNLGTSVSHLSWDFGDYFVFFSPQPVGETPELHKTCLLTFRCLYIRSRFTPYGTGPGLLLVSCSKSSDRYARLELLLFPGKQATLDAWVSRTEPLARPAVVIWQHAWPQEWEEAVVGKWRSQLHQSAPRERENLELERLRPVHIASSFGFKRTDKYGGGTLDMHLDFSLVGNKEISEFCRREWLGTWEAHINKWAACQ